MRLLSRYEDRLNSVSLRILNTTRKSIEASALFLYTIFVKITDKKRRIMSRQSTTQTANTVVILTLIMTIIIDVMGVGLVFPIIPSLFIGKSALLVNPETSDHLRTILYGLAMGAWPAGIFLGTPFLGQLSDRFGRKRIILLCLGLTAVSYALAGVAIVMHRLILFLLARFLAGFFGGSFSIAQAVIADISPAEKKARNLGWITLAASLGIIIGPAISSLTLGNGSISAFAKPFWFATFLAAANTLSIFLLLKETFTTNTHAATIQLYKIFTAFTTIFTDKRTWILACVFLLMELGWGFYIQEIPLVLTQLFHFQARSIGYFFTLVGFAMMLCVLFIQPKLISRFQLKPLYIASATIQSAILILSVVIPTLRVHVGVVVIAAIANILCYTSCLTLFSNAVGDDEQGHVMGGTGCAFGAAWMLNALLLGPLTNISIFLPLILASLGIFLSALCLIPYKPEKKSS